MTPEEKHAARTRGSAGQGRRQELLGIARRLFANKGFDGSSISELAEAAGIRKASVYHHFKTKDAIYCAVLKEIVDDLHQLVESARNYDSDPLSKLDLLGGLVVDYLAERPEAASLLVREMMGLGMFMDGAGMEPIRATLEATVSFLGAGMDAGAFRRQDPAQLALSIIGLHLYYFAAPRVSGQLEGRNVFEPDSVRARKEAVLSHVRSLCT